MKIHATRLGLIPSSEIAFLLRVEADRLRRAESRARAREGRARERVERRRRLWARGRAALGLGPPLPPWRPA